LGNPFRQRNLGVKRLVFPLSGTKQEKDISNFDEIENMKHDFTQLFIEFLDNLYSETMTIFGRVLFHKPNCSACPPDADTLDVHLLHRYFHKAKYMLHTAAKTGFFRVARFLLLCQGFVPVAFFTNHRAGDRLLLLIIWLTSLAAMS
jgi:hypothetical protein